MEIENKPLELPIFIPRAVVRDTINFRVVMDWKPGQENQQGGERFFIEPKNATAEIMLQLAADVHNVKNFNKRKVIVGDKTLEMSSLRADFIKENMPSLLQATVEIPEEGKDSIPSPDRMEKCLELHPNRYTFSD